MAARYARTLALTTALAALTFGAALAAPAGAEVKWLCLPGSADNPCRESLTTTVYAPDGSSRTVDPVLPADPPIDCFYVYPTVSEQPGPNANKDVDPPIRAIAKYQAQRFSQFCRVFAPVYRQTTLTSIVTGGNAAAAASELAFGDVREAWLEYLAKFNSGRGVVLIGHSQGTKMLRALIRKEIDANADVRRRIVSALLLGGNVLVRKGQKANGDFANLPACEAPGQTGCIVAWSAYMDPPPGNTRFGKPPADGVAQPLDLPGGSAYEVLCTDPEKLTGGTGELTSLLRSESFPGVIGLLLIKMFNGPSPSAPTPWLQAADRYTGKCETVNGANVLMTTPVGSSRRLSPSPDDTWGLHLGDVNLAFGELESLVASQSASYLAVPRATRPPLGRVRLKLTRRRAGFTVRVSVPAPSGSRVSITLMRGKKTLGRRTVTVKGRTARATFRVRRSGRYRATARLG